MSPESDDELTTVTFYSQCGLKKQTSWQTPPPVCQSWSRLHGTLHHQHANLKPVGTLHHQHIIHYHICAFHHQHVNQYPTDIFHHQHGSYYWKSKMSVSVAGMGNFNSPLHHILVNENWNYPHFEIAENKEKILTKLLGVK